MILPVALQLSNLLLCAFTTLILSFGPLSRLSILWRNVLVGLVFGIVVFLGQSNAYVLPGLAFLAGFAVVGLIARAHDLRRAKGDRPWGHVSRQALVICLAGYLVVQFLPPVLYPPVIVQGAADYRGPAFALAFLGTGVASILVTAGLVNLMHLLSRAPLALERLVRRTEQAHVAARIGTFDADYSTGLAHFDLGMRRLYRMEPGPDPVPLQSWSAGIHPEDRAAFAQTLDHARAGGERGQIEFRYLHADGSESRILNDWFSERDADGRITRIVGVHVDLTAVRASEAEVRTQTAIANTAQKDAAIGKLSGGIAHDFNNILASSWAILNFWPKANAMPTPGR